MRKKKSYTVTQLLHKPSLFRTAVPFEITYRGRVIALTVKPGVNWRTCEKCGENTQNIIEWKDDSSQWQKLILCDKCSDESLG